MQRLIIQNSENIKVEIQKYFSKSDEARFIHRLHGIILLLENPANTPQMVSELFGQCHTTLTNWVNKLNETGNIESLRSVKNTGRPPKLTTEQKEGIKKILQEDPKQAGIVANIWDGKSLSYYINKRYGVVLKTRACQNLFKELGFRLKRARPVVANGDEVKKEAFKKTKRVKGHGTI